METNTPGAVNIPHLYFTLEYDNDKLWAKLLEPCGYEDFLAKAREKFPQLIDKNLMFTDEKDVRLEPEFIPEYVRISQCGVLLKIKVINRKSIFMSIPIEQENVEESNLLQIGLEPNPKRPRLETYDCNNIISKEILLRYLKTSTCGEDIIRNYEENKYLTDKYRKQLVHLVTQLLEYQKKVERNILSSEKCQYGQAIIDLFPNLKYDKGKYGYEHFYDPEKKTGYLCNKLSNLRRTNPSSKTKRKAGKHSHIYYPSTSSTGEKVDETDELKDAIEFMKSATIEQKEEIFEKTIFTFDIRRYKYKNEDFFTTFPRFLDFPELIDVEFRLIFPKIDTDRFMKIYPEYANAIINVYEKEKSDKSFLEWDRLTNSILCLTQLTPPTARGKKLATREKTRNIIQKLIVFRESGTPIQCNDDEGKQPKLIACGPNKLAVDQYFITIDQRFILLPTKNVLKAVDYLFKAHYVFHTEFDRDLFNFWILLQHHFFKIDSECSNTVIDTFTKIEVFKKKLTEESTT